MKIHIVEPYHSHAMQRMSLPLDDLKNLHEITKSEAVDPEADVNIHMPWHSMVGYEGGGKHIIAYTHMNPPDAPQLLDACDRADIVTCMSFTGRRELIQLGVDPKKIWVIYSAADNFVFRRRTIGIVGNPQPNGRKRESLLVDLAWKYSLDAFEFAFIGIGWEETVGKLNSLGVAAVSGVSNDGNLQSIYKQFDALLVTGYVEGGSLPILEAMAVGIPVISPAFGYASDLLDEHYETEDELMTMLENLAVKPVLNHQIVKSWTWKDYAAEYALLIARLTGTSAEIYPERGTDRYCQLLDVIDEVRPSAIVEIGTWNGHRAIQMIQQAAKYHKIEKIAYQGYDLFDMQTGEHYRRELSKIAYPLQVVEKKLKPTGSDVELIEGETCDTLEDNLISADLYYIDGGHSEETIGNDWREVMPYLDEQSVVVFDDYYHEGKPEGVGCNPIIDSLDRNKYEVTHLPKVTKASDGRVIGMVKVRKHADLSLRMYEQTQTGTHALDEREPAYSVSGVWVENAPSTAVLQRELERITPTSGAST